MAKFKKVLNSWFVCNGLSVKLKVNIKGGSDLPTLAWEKVQSKEELDTISRMARPRVRFLWLRWPLAGLDRKAWKTAMAVMA